MKREKKHDSVLIDMRTRIFTRYVIKFPFAKEAGRCLDTAAGMSMSVSFP